MDEAPLLNAVMDGLNHGFSKVYPKILKHSAERAIQSAKGDKDRLKDEIAFECSFVVDSWIAWLILASSKNADAFFKGQTGGVMLEAGSWEELFGEVAMCAMEKDVTETAEIQDFLACQEDDTASEKIS